MNSVLRVKFPNYLQTEIEEFQSRSAECNNGSHGVAFWPVTKSIHTHAAEESKRILQGKVSGLTQWRSHMI